MLCGREPAAWGLEWVEALEARYSVGWELLGQLLHPVVAHAIGCYAYELEHGL